MSCPSWPENSMRPNPRSVSPSLSKLDGASCFLVAIFFQARWQFLFRRESYSISTFPPPVAQTKYSTSPASYCQCRSVSGALDSTLFVEANQTFEKKMVTCMYRLQGGPEDPKISRNSSCPQAWAGHALYQTVALS